MISLARVINGTPIPLTKTIYFYQPTLSEIVDNIGESTYWILLNVWTIKRSDIIAEENSETMALHDYDVWKQYVLSTPVLKDTLKKSCQVFLKAKIEFFDISGTIYIGEKESGVILDEVFYLLMRDVCFRVMPTSSASKKEQYQETDHMSARERQMIEKMRSSAQKIEETKNPSKKPEDFLGNRILGLVAVGGYTFEQVYNMTMLQFNMLLQKYVDIQTFELRTQLSPYISSEDGQNRTDFWLD